MCIRAVDSPQEDLQKYFNETNEFIHKARTLENGNVLIHWYIRTMRACYYLLFKMKMCIMILEFLFQLFINTV
jgi:hypothetical protein